MSYEMKTSDLRVVGTNKIQCKLLKRFTYIFAI